MLIFQRLPPYFGTIKSPSTLKPCASINNRTSIAFAFPSFLPPFREAETLPRYTTDEKPIDSTRHVDSRKNPETDTEQTKDREPHRIIETLYPISPHVVRSSKPLHRPIIPKLYAGFYDYADTRVERYLYLQTRISETQT